MITTVQHYLQSNYKELQQWCINFVVGELDKNYKLLRIELIENARQEA